MMDVLSDDSKFESLGGCDVADRTDLNERALQAFLYRNFKEKKISEDVYKRIRPVGSIRPRMYGLPKVHKPNPIPLRPVVSMVGSAHHEISRWLADQLKPVVERFSSHTVKDSFSFCDILREKENIGDEAFMCSFDVKSLFTNVPLDETLNICLDTLYRSEDVPPPCIEETLFRKLLLKCTRDVEFSFDGWMYRQVDGVAMGSPLGPVLANIFMGYCESLIPDNQWPDLYRRFVDDTFSLFCNGREDGQSFLTLLNGLHPALQFTMEMENNGKLPFMDVKVFRGTQRFTTTVYRKPTFTGVYTRWDSFSPTDQKIALIRSLTLRAKRICSAEHLDDEILVLQSIFAKNGYPAPIVERVMNQTLHSKPLPLTVERKKIFMRLPWMGSGSLAIKNRVEHATKKVVPWCRVVCCFTSRNAFNTSKKDKLPAENLSNVVYFFNCVCNHSYVGRTTLRLGERMGQHIPIELVESVLPSVGGDGKRGRGRPRKNPEGNSVCQAPLTSGDNVSARTRSKSRLSKAFDQAKPTTEIRQDPQQEVPVSSTLLTVTSKCKEDTAITCHLKQSTSCLIGVCQNVKQHFGILAKARNLQHLQILEAIFIALRKPKLCVQKERLTHLSLVVT